jgi:hypothetical protein
MARSDSSTLTFSLRTALRVEMRRRLHRGEAQQLQQVVLQHVAHRAGVVVVVAAAFEPDGFGHRDLHLLDVPRIPQGLEQGIAETQRQQVLHAFLAEVVVDPEHAVLVEYRGHAVVDRDRGGEIVADRLLQQYPGAGIGQAGLAQRAAQRCVVARRSAEVIDRVARAARRADRLGQRLHRGRALDRCRAVIHAFEQGAQRGFVALGRRHPLFDAARHQLAESVAVQVAARRAEDAQFARQQAIALQAVERGQQHALRQVAGGAEDGEQGSGVAGHAVPSRGLRQSSAKRAARPTAYVCRSPAPIHKKPRRMARRGWGILRLRPLRGLRSGQSDISVRQNR